MFLDRDQVTETSVLDYATEISDLQLNGFPPRFNTNLGNGQPLIATTKRVNKEGEVLWVNYRQSLGCITVRIFND